MSKRFTLAEAESLIPQVEPLLREAMAMKAEFQAAERALQAINERIILAGGILIDRTTAIEARSRREVSAARLKSIVQQVQELGCVIKDLDMGLIDFPTEFGGSEVYLCWKLGEDGIGFWHGVDEGFRGRKAIDDDFRRRHRGDPAH